MSDVVIKFIDSRNDMLQTGKAWWIATQGEQLVGMLSMVVECGEFAWFSDLFVPIEHRGKGFASKLLDEAESIIAKEAAHVGIVGFCCAILRSNATSRSIAERRGYRHAYSWDKDTLLYMKGIA